MEKLRKCIGCGELKDASQLIKITNDKINNQVVINPNSKIFGRSVYLCYNKLCIENALKKDKISKVLKHHVSEALKGKLVKIE